MKKQVSVLGKRKLFEEKPKKSLDAILSDWQNEAGITEEEKKAGKELGIKYTSVRLKNLHD